MVDKGVRQIERFLIERLAGGVFSPVVGQRCSLASLIGHSVKVPINYKGKEAK